MSRKKKTPALAKATGATGQLSFLPTPEFSPILPPLHSGAARALVEMLERPITQIDWLMLGNGWRLAAVIKDLDYLGWEPQSVRILRNGWGRPIAQYSLHQKAKQAAYLLMKGGAANA